jgi:hypothetical protein
MVGKAAPAKPAPPVDWVGIGAIALVGAVVFGVLCSRVSDWAVMTDELLYERLALSFTDGALVPTLHGERADVYAILYPLLISPVLGLVSLPDAVRVVHGLNGVLFASACLPAYLLAREALLPRFAALAVGLFSVAIPWTVIGAFVMTEAAAYPAALWALFAIQRAVVVPSAGRDLVAVGAIGVATLARPQLAALGAVLVLAAISQELRFGRWRRHAVAFGVAILGVLVLLLGGAGLVGSYAPALEEGSLVSVDIVRSAILHLDVTAVALGVVPLILGGGWAVAAVVRPPGAERLATASVVVASTVVLAFESGSVVERFGLGLDVKDRYFFYVAPLLFLATACALDDRPRLAGLLGVGSFFVLTVGLEKFEGVHGVNIDSPASATHEALTRFGNDVGMSPSDMITIAGGVLVAALFFALRRFATRALMPLILGLVLVFVFAESAYTWNRMLESSGPSARPLTGAQSSAASWIDQSGPQGTVAILPYAADAEWFRNAVIWWDTEFWNESVDRAYTVEGDFVYTPETFPRPDLKIDSNTGLISGGSPDYVARSTVDARLRPAGLVVAAVPEYELIDLEVPLRAAWMTLGLDPDGWTRGRQPAYVRVFPPAGAVALRLVVTAPPGPPSVDVSVGPIPLTLGPGESREVTLDVCVPDDGFGEVEIRVGRATQIRSVPANPPLREPFRLVGVRLSRIEAAAPTGSCQP